jgi:hypothetical protein
MERNLQKRKYHVLAIVFFLLLLTNPFLVRGLETVSDSVHALYVRRYYQQWPSLETTYFHLRYSQGDHKLAQWVGNEADLAVNQVMDILPHDHQGQRPWLVLVPDQDTLRRAFGWSDGTGALGVYLANTVKILTPEAWDWVEKDRQRDVFRNQGPLVHEYTHYVLDLRTGGNYTRWFSEGLSQLTEYHLLGYEWLEATSSLANALYTLDELERSFDALTDQPLVYRQALSMVTYLESLQGLDGINQFIDTLGQGTSFYEALQQDYGLTREQFLIAWQDWYRQDARWERIK